MKKKQKKQLRVPPEGPRLAGRSPTQAEQPGGRRCASRKSWLLPASLFSFAFAISLIFTGVQFPGGDARYVTALTIAMATDQTFDCANAGIPLSRGNLYKGKDGGIYTKYPPGQALAQVPFYFIFNEISPFRQRTSTSGFLEILSLRLTPALLTALAVMILFFLLRNYFGYSEALSLLTSLLYLFCTQASFYSKSNYTEGLQTTLIIAGAYVLLKPKKNTSLVLFSFAFSFLVLTKPALLLGFPAFFYLIWVKKAYKTKSLFAWVASFIIIFGAAFFLFYYNYARNEDIFEFGYKIKSGFLPRGARVVSRSSRFLETMKDLVLSPRRSIILYNPMIILAIPGFFWLKDRKYLIFFAGLTIIFILIYSLLYGGIWSGHYGQRYLVPLIILLMPFMAATLKKISELKKAFKRGSIAFVVALCVVSLYISFLGMAYFHFAAKQLCFIYDELAQKYGLLKCNESLSSSNVAIYHYLLWSDYPNQDEYEEFPWVDLPITPTIATQTLTSRHFPSWYVGLDLMFFDPEVLEATAAAAMVKYALFILLGISAVGVTLAFRETA